MNEYFKEVTEVIALSLEFCATILIAWGGIKALFKLVLYNLPQFKVESWRKLAWKEFAGWLLIGLEFTLGADIIRSAVSPTWDSIGQLAAIAVIRTFLGFFLERDLEIVSEKELK